MSGVAKGFVGLLLFVFTIFVLVLVLVNVPPSERFIIAKVNGALSGSFKGRIHIESIGTLNLFGISGANAQVYGPDG